MIGQILVANDNGLYAIRLLGDVRMVLCLSFDKYIQTMFANSEFKSVVFDLTEAQAIDSTTLGLMAKIALHCKKRDAAKPVLLVDAAGMIRLLEAMGFDDIFVISGCRMSTTESSQCLDCEEGTEEEFKSQVIEAHKVLMSMNDSNRRAFRELVDVLERD